MTEVKAKLRYLRVSPRKVRLLADLIKGMSLKEAESQIRFSTKKSNPSLLKLLKSAEQNARHNFRLKSDNLYIKEITVDVGPVLKRYMPRARGRAATIRRRSSHITVVLGDKK
ncbi:MAG: 50S ribosomal protein L22 [Candidatus Tagabacteria bacterium CG09_land_8_20_14_0_10_41_14]|uniref:Large ribosomal subunit protein uL22 n=2 Tax=Candidatus Tagaibacteriota TaxID=1817918 RepID=A0A2H0WNI7_9BACT|nr:MAG: 50S ribosomal protein L22 [Candidatus Tagabacteria bacterium CG09_land_8_20_14_0_10_41_14]PJE73139.1 MAG: 50S ribosomal protein L22 [Candidatus Tagabacteria bacterium CG10_big_fil_rev_8_21_14_0_10_40_13]